MDTNTIPTVDTEILKHIVTNTDSAIVLVFVIIAVLAVPVGILIHKHNKQKHAADEARRTQEHEAEATRRQHDIEREQNIIKVVTANTEVMAGLKTTLDNNNAAMKETIERIHTRIDGQYDILQGISTGIARVIEQITTIQPKPRKSTAS